MVPVYIHPLSAVAPVKLVYKFNKEEHLTGTLNTFKNGFSYYKHEGLQNFHDAVLSNKTCLILTDNISLKKVFDSDSKQIKVGTIAGCLYLKASSGYYTSQYVTSLKETLYLGGAGNRLLVNIVPIQENLVYLKVGQQLFLTVDKEYPYTIRVTQEILEGENAKRQQFEIDYKESLISFKSLTKEGWRYVSYGADRTIRAVGLMLNDTIVNSYLFSTEFVSQDSLHYDFDAKNSEIKYYNEITTYNNRDNVNIKTEKESNTNLLLTVPTSEISKSNEVSVNIALTKTNFSSSGSYITKQTP
jgi:hypothetical protein